MIASTSPEKRRLFNPQRFTKSRKLTRDHNQNSTGDKSLPIIPQLPVTIHEGLFSSLSSLDLSNTKLQSLPECVFSLNNLEHLKIERNEFLSLPSEICKLQSLKSINASENKIQGLPDNFGNLELLEIVNLSFNNLCHLPSSCSALNHLKVLFISNNKFKYLPECIEEGMRNLQVLDTSYNPLKFIASPVSTKLTQFSAKGLKNCRFFPEWLLNPKFWKLEEIILDDSIFTKFSFQNNSDLHLRSLSMLNCSLKDSNLERIISNMVELEKLRVGNKDHTFSRECNTFCFLPGSNLKNPKAVNEMNVRATALSVLPHTVNMFHNLERLDLGRNNITWLPDEICELKHLKVLIIDTNNLHSLPKEFGKLKKLEELVACHNKLSKLPESMQNLENLEIIDLYDNDFSEMPTELGKQTHHCLDLERNFFVISNLLVRITTFMEYFFLVGNEFKKLFKINMLLFWSFSL